MEETMMTGRTGTLALAVTALSLAGCSWQNTLTGGTENPCASVHEIVADYPTGFASYRRGGDNFRAVTIYRAREELIKGHCEIWAWGTTDSAYVCTVSAPDSEVASERYTRAAGQLSGCLGPEWRSEEQPRQRDGEAAGLVRRYSKDGDHVPAVSLHNVRDGRSHSLYLYIGSPAHAPD